MKPDRPLLNYYGGKWSAAEWVIEHFPSHEVYVEPFAGAASILLSKPRAKREIVNDLDHEIVNLFTVVREHGLTLKTSLMLTPYSREEYDRCKQWCDNPIEQARRTIIKSYFGIGDAIQNTTNGFRQSKDANTCNARSWVTYVNGIDQIIERFRGVLIENRDYRKVMTYYDSESTLFYLDPPYFKQTRSEKHGYKFEFEVKDHEEMCEFLTTIKGMVILSGYELTHDCIYDRLNWQKSKKNFRTQKHNFKEETLWLSPAVQKQMAQQSFFDKGEEKP